MAVSVHVPLKLSRDSRIKESYTCHGIRAQVDERAWSNEGTGRSIHTSDLSFKETSIWLVCVRLSTIKRTQINLVYFSLGQGKWWVLKLITQFAQWPSFCFGGRTLKTLWETQRIHKVSLQKEKLGILGDMFECHYPVGITCGYLSMCCVVAYVDIVVLKSGSYLLLCCGAQREPLFFKSHTLLLRYVWDVNPVSPFHLIVLFCPYSMKLTLSLSNKPLLRHLWFQRIMSLCGQYQNQTDLGKDILTTECWSWLRRRWIGWKGWAWRLACEKSH